MKKTIKFIVCMLVVLTIAIIIIQINAPLFIDKVTIYTVDQDGQIMVIDQFKKENSSEGNAFEDINYSGVLPSENIEDYVSLTIRVYYKNISVSPIVDAKYLYENDSEYADRVIWGNNFYIMPNSIDRFSEEMIIYTLYVYKKDLSDEQLEDIINNTKLTLLYETELFGTKEKKIDISNYNYEWENK